VTGGVVLGGIQQNQEVQTVAKQINLSGNGLLIQYGGQVKDAQVGAVDVTKGVVLRCLQQVPGEQLHPMQSTLSDILLLTKLVGHTKDMQVSGVVVNI
jgi:hypothetical protein